MLILTVILSAIIAYFIGNFSSATTISRLVFRKDVRESGSGSAGATNMFRTFGARWGFLILLLDALKGFVAYYVGYGLGSLLTGGEYAVAAAAVAGVFVVIGHDWPILYRFRGGKGVATSLGVALAAAPLVGLLGFAIAIIAVLLTNYMSIGSIAGVFFAFVLSLILEPTPTRIMLFVFLLLILWQHRANIGRLRNGTENTLMSRSLLDRIMSKDAKKEKKRRNLR